MGHRRDASQKLDSILILSFAGYQYLILLCNILLISILQFYRAAQYTISELPSYNIWSSGAAQEDFKNFHQENRFRVVDFSSLRKFNQKGSIAFLLPTYTHT